MDFFHHRDNEIYCEDTPLRTICVELGTPAYVYSRKTLKRHLTELKKAFGDYPTTPCFAIKANSNISLLKEIFAAGYGADVVSIGELERSLIAGVKPEQIVFSGVGKQRHEIRRAIEVGILSFNVESDFELEMIHATARELGKVARISLRINPDIDAKTNPKITTGLYSTKFGMHADVARQITRKLTKLENLRLIGLACHIGSQITDLRPLQQAAVSMAQLAQEFLDTGMGLEIINMGGGLGIRYADETPPSLSDYARALTEAIAPTGLRLVIEPGRVIAGNAGIMLTKVLGTKHTGEKFFAIVDAAMNDLPRPSMYDSHHGIELIEARSGLEHVYDIVGPICETGDFLGKARLLPQLQPGDVLMIRGTGAYAASMASNYNSRPRAPEVLVDGDRFQVIRRREPLDSLWRYEQEEFMDSSDSKSK